MGDREGENDMRRGSKPEIIYIDGRVVAIKLSADNCAEHEWGIRQLKEAFGIPDDIKVYGIKRRKITCVPKGLAWVTFSSKWFAGKQDVERGFAEKIGDAVLAKEGFVFHPWYGEEPYKLAQNSELYGYGLQSAWSENDFAAVSNMPEHIKDLREIFTAFEKKNICIFFAGCTTPFENPGLMIAIRDRLPKNTAEEWHKFDKDQHAIQKEFKRTGIEALLAKAGKRYFALSPRRREDGTLWYWLNPYDQRENNFGWFTLEDLQLWAVNEGPIPVHKDENVKVN